MNAFRGALLACIEFKMADTKKRDRDDSSSGEDSEGSPKTEVFKKPKTKENIDAGEEEEEEWIGPLPTEAAKPKKKKGLVIFTY